MSRTVCKEIYTFDELGDTAKEKARVWYREGGFDYDWWDVVYGDAKECGQLMGWTIERIYFSGFPSQGDGACFEGTWRASEVKVEELRKHAPADMCLHRLALAFRELTRRKADGFATVKQQGHYQHRFCTSFNVDNLQSNDEDTFIDTSRDFMAWIYQQLEREYKYISADEQVGETIRANAYEFNENGSRARDE